MAIGIYQNKIKYLSTTAAFISAALFFCPYIHADTTFESIKKIGSYSVTITTVLVFLFNGWMWKWLPEFLIGRPDLNGTWKGKLEYRWANPDDKKDIKNAVKPIYISIKQTFLSIKICVFTSESESHSLSSNIIQTDTGAWELSYTYDNTPDRRLRDHSQRHRGAAELKINRVNGEYTIQGDYWTDRRSQGHMSFSDRRTEFATNYTSAHQMFEGTI
jgi:hypothetical protein